MIIQLKLQGPLQKYGKSAGMFEYETAAKTCSLDELLQDLGIPASSVSFITVNGLKKEWHCLLKGGETVVIYPRVAGG